MKYRCVYCGAETESANAAGWDWWTGYLPHTEAACLNCKTKNANDIARSRDYANSPEAKARFCERER
jgi:hypothetical protein